MLAAGPISDALITGIPADTEPLCGSAVVYVVVVIVIIIIIIISFLDSRVTVLCVAARMQISGQHSSSYKR